MDGAFLKERNDEFLGHFLEMFSAVSVRSESPSSIDDMSSAEIFIISFAACLFISCWSWKTPDGDTEMDMILEWT